MTETSFLSTFAATLFALLNPLGRLPVFIGYTAGIGMSVQRWLALQQVFETYKNQNPQYIHTFYWWKNNQGLFSAWEDEEDGKRTLFLGLVACSLGDLPELLVDIRKFAADKKCDFIFQIAFDLPQITSPLLAAAFEKKWKRSNAFVFEKTRAGRE